MVVFDDFRDHQISGLNNIEMQLISDFSSYFHQISDLINLESIKFLIWTVLESIKIQIWTILRFIICIQTVRHADINFFHLDDFGVHQISDMNNFELHQMFDFSFFGVHFSSDWWTPK